MKLDITPKPSNKRASLILATGLTLIVGVVVALTNIDHVPSVSANEIEFVEVQQGALDIKLPVYGHFRSEFERLVSAPVSGQVTDVFIRAGADVKPDTLIAKLSNPDLIQEHFAAQTKLEQMEAEYKLASLERQNSELAFQGDIAELEHQIKKVELDVEVNKKLLVQGITAKLDLEKSELNLALLQKKLTFTLYRFEKVKEVNKLALEQQKILLTQQDKLEKLIASKVAGLAIKAGIAGTLQKVDIKLGEQVTIGQPLAQIGSKHQLIAKVNIPQRVAQSIELGSQLTIKVSDVEFNAQITQLGSIVENGFIIAEAKLGSNVPSSIRPSQPLSGQLFVRHQANALFVKQQPGYKPMTVNFIYKASENKQTLDKTKITFGELTNNLLVVEQGLKVGDRLVSSDLSEWQEYPQLKLQSDSIL